MRPGVPTIGLLGDVMLGRGVAQTLGATPPEKLWAPEIRDIAAQCDAVILNLECCISARGRPTERIRGKPFFFRTPPSAIDTLRAVRASAVSLANNHALDFGEAALEDTLAALDAASIAAAGAGRDRDAARAGIEIDAGSMRIGLIAASDHPSEYAADQGSWGIASADFARGAPDWLLSEIERMRPHCDIVLPFLHWGPNMTPRPAPWQRDLAQELLDAGADAVAGHSAHVFHGVEWTGGRPILYDLGDALDDYAIDPDLRNDLGVMALWRPEESELELLGLRLEYCYTRLATDRDADWIAARLEAACADLGTAVTRTADQRFTVAPG